MIRSLIVFTIVWFSPLAMAKDIVLQISFSDALAISKSETEALAEALRQANPSVQVISIDVPASRLGGDKNKVRNKMIQELKALRFQGEDQIRTILIQTHGGTDKRKNRTILKYIGEVDDKQVNAAFEDFFAPVKSRISRDSHVVLYACSTFCGSDDRVGGRVQTLLKALNAPDGSLYGGYTAHESVGIHLDMRKVWYWILGISAATYMNYFSLMNHDPVAYQALTSSAVLAEVTHDFLKYVALAFGYELGFRPLYTVLRSQSGESNSGRIFTLKDGEVSSVQEASFTRNQNEVLGFIQKTCQAVLSEGRKPAE